MSERILWLTPNKAENISVGRRRIATHLEAAGFAVELETGTLSVLHSTLWSPDIYDAVVGTTRAGAIVGSVLSSVRGWPLVVDHVDPIRQLRETSNWPLPTIVDYLERFAFRQSVHTLYVYPEERDRVTRFAPAATLTELGVEYERFARPDQSVLDAARDRLSDVDQQEHLAVYVGGLEPIYHIEPLLESVEYLDDWSLLVLGTGSLDEAVELASESKPVIYPGSVPHEEVPGYLHLADVGISLVDDSNTLKVLEYGAAGLPTVQLAGRAEERFGDAVEYCKADARSVARAIRQAQGRPTEPLRDIARAHSWEQIAQQYATVIREALAD